MSSKYNVYKVEFNYINGNNVNIIDIEYFDVEGPVKYSVLKYYPCDEHYCYYVNLDATPEQIVRCPYFSRSFVISLIDLVRSNVRQLKIDSII